MRAAITGMGVVASNGIGVAEFAEALRCGRQNLAQLSGVPVPRGKAFVGLVNEPKFDFPDRAFRMSRLAINEALNRSGFRHRDGREVALILSTVTGDSRALEELYSEFIKDDEPDDRVKRAISLFPTGTLLNSIGNCFGWYGPRLVVSSVCASGNIALGLALDMLRLGRCRAVVVPGVELVKLSAIWGAERSGLVGRALRPFHRKRDGSVLGEGAGVIIMEHPDDVRGQQVLGWVEGFGCASNLGSAATTLSDDDSGLRRAMSLAVADADRVPADIEYVNAHAPGMPLIDRLECQAISDLFGSHAKNISINSTKSLTTYMGAASGVVEIVGTLLQMQQGFLHGHAGLDDVDPALAVEVIGNQPVERKVTKALSNACGGGGLRTSVLITAAQECAAPPTQRAEETSGQIIITGVGSVSALGAGNASVFAAPRVPDSDAQGCLPWFDIDWWYPRETNYSYMNRSAQLGAAAGAIAIAEAALDGAYASDRVAIISGSLLGGSPQASAVICQKLIGNPNSITPNMALDHGMHLSTVLVRRHFGYNGVSCTLTGSCVAGLQALRVGVDLLRTGRADAAVVLGHDALDQPLRWALPWLDGCLPSHQLGEGAGALVLEWSGNARNKGQAHLGGFVMMAGHLDDAESSRSLVEDLSAGIAEESWNDVYLVGPQESLLKGMAEKLLDVTGRTARIQSLRSSTRYCMAADPLFAVAAAAAKKESALILAAEVDGSVAALCLSPN